MALTTFKGPVDSTAGFKIGGVAISASAAELNILDGVTASAAELNILDGVTSSAAELNILDGVTSSTAELNILDGVTASAAEISTLASSGITNADLVKVHAVVSTAAELDTIYLNASVKLGAAVVAYVPIPEACTVNKIYATIDGILETADEVITTKNNAGTGLTSGVITLVQSASAAGNTYSVTPSANNTFTAGQNLRLDCNGGNTNAVTVVRVCIVASRTS